MAALLFAIPMAAGVAIGYAAGGTTRNLVATQPTVMTHASSDNAATSGGGGSGGDKVVVATSGGGGSGGDPAAVARPAASMVEYAL